MFSNPKLSLRVCEIGGVHRKMESKFTYVSGHPAIVIGAQITISTCGDKDYLIKISTSGWVLESGFLPSKAGK